MSKVLQGEAVHSIDTKGRMIVPSKMRDLLGPSFVITKGMDKCLFIYPNDEWAIFEKKLQGLPMINKKAREFVRHFNGSATECEVDNQGRVLIPAGLREFAGITKDVKILGMIDHAEIWSKELWDELNNPDDFDFEGLASDLQDMGISI